MPLTDIQIGLLDDAMRAARNSAPSASPLLRISASGPINVTIIPGYVDPATATYPNEVSAKWLPDEHSLSLLAPDDIEVSEVTVGIDPDSFSGLSLAADRGAWVSAQLTEASFDNVVISADQAGVSAFLGGVRHSIHSELSPAGEIEIALGQGEPYLVTGRQRPGEGFFQFTSGQRNLAN